MKRIVCLLLACLLPFCLIACAGSESDPQPQATTQQTQPQASTLQAGFGRINVTPETAVGLDGYGDHTTRKSGTVLDYIYTTCVALQNGEQTILVYTVDVCSLADKQMEAIRNVVTIYTGVPNENIFIGATHTHSAPRVENNEAWEQTLYTACANAGKNAIADLAPAKMEAGTAILEGLNFVRHYLMNDGTYYGSNFGSKESGFKAHALDHADQQMVLVKLDRDSKKDILMVNWQAHPASVPNEVEYTAVSADFVGALRSKVETEADLLVAYYTGAAGNINKDSLIESERHGLDYKAYGQKLADCVMENLPKLAPVDASNIQSTKVLYPVEVDHSWDHMINEANEVYDLWQNSSKAEADELCKTYGFTSVYQARAIRYRYDRPATENRELRVFRVGPIGFASGTYEMFSDHAEYVKENSPFDITFVMTGCANYIGNKAAFEYRSYETDTGLYASGTGEKLAEEFVKLLNSIQ